MAVIKPGDFGDDRVKELLTRHLEGMHANSPPGQVFALDWSGLQKPEISFYTLWEGEDLLGFGALKELEPRAGEIKSMRTADAHLRKGFAAMILDHIIAEARQRGYTRLSLETGSGPAFEPALTLYRKHGFSDGGAFGGVFRRTGQTFMVWPQTNPSASPTCRFFSTAFAPKSSHFYTPFAFECAIVKTEPAWQFEAIAFYIQLAGLDGLCSGGTVPLYRLYNNGMGGAPNHRYTTGLTILNQMVAAGWIFEGNGDTKVFACVPQ